MNFYNLNYNKILLEFNVKQLCDLYNLYANIQEYIIIIVTNICK